MTSREVTGLEPGAERPHLASVEPRPAASVMVFRSAPSGPVVLYLRRNPELAFHGGDWVFPGGRIDAADREAAGSHDEATAARRAAVREAGEEAGLDLPVDGLAFAVHWTTPLARPIRFAAWFFIAETTSDVVQIDGPEIHDYRWMRPADALTAQAAGTMQLAAPAFALTTRLAGFPDVRSVFNAPFVNGQTSGCSAGCTTSPGAVLQSTSRMSRARVVGTHSAGAGLDTGCGCSTAGGATSGTSDRQPSAQNT